MQPTVRPPVAGTVRLGPIRAVLDRAHAGQGLGAELLDWAGTKAADEGADWLRVDAWTTNEHLQHYYLRQGFTYVRTVVLPHNPSGALFQRPAERIPPHTFRRPRA
ncbi:MAG TPA: GNAT family N-acetyltransferase [Actinomycetota bacterium]|nr:GNAT family N-acetyltransferase [Actinomycetota bacterium]